MELDKVDREIITMFSKNPRVSQEEIAEKLEMSQPSIAGRVKNLRERGALQTIVGIDPLKMRLNIAKVDVSTTDASSILKMFKNCPYFINGYSVSGDYNVCLFLMSESIATMEAIINHHIRTRKNVSDVKFNVVISTEKPLIVPTALSVEKQTEPPCGTKLECNNCLSFKEEKCMGCPAIDQYQGWLF